MTDAPSPAYGTTRGPTVSYLEVERAAIAILKAGQRPSVERVRAALGRGSPQTLLSALQRFWRDLGTRIEADPAALSRLPLEIVEVVETVWQRALALAAQAAKHDDNAARERLRQLQLENEVRAQSFLSREKELEVTGRAREQALADTQAHLRTVMGLFEKDRASLRAQQRRIAALEGEVQDYRQRLAGLITRAVSRQQRKTRPSAITGKRKQRTRASQSGGRLRSTPTSARRRSRR